ncbi:hypothetical protein HQQ94_03190 [Shewanella sp. VB17]|uniref:hypothetical protein n=1 Tax=Shewanella sp. VB17 TaxID=2739432 RepID=UPI00156624BF|nr:hypothetical protein [Shewanella sp. VB17]NRD72259.1 hypothetical protein [Shewanella sp. VB17]
MLVVTNYPNVPIATTNVATDAARTDNQQRPPILPPQELTKGHNERAFNPQHERTAQQADVLARLNEKGQGNQQRSGQKEQNTHQQQTNQLIAPKTNELMRNKPALKRRDVHTQHNENEINIVKNNHQKKTQDITLAQSPEIYQAFAQHIESFYYQQTEPKQQAAISTLI